MAVTPKRGLERFSRLLEVTSGDPWSHPLSGEHDWSPPVDIFEDEERLLVEVELPGVTREAIRLTVTSSQILLEGTRVRALGEEGIRFSRVEQFFGRFRRILELPRVVNTSQAKAKLGKGVLTITLPKVRDRRGRVSQIVIE